ncbi:hypothetical protein ACIA5D_39980 [Actinoplanes sp. NPDC051513]|uniref:hypothetical protein n=1 Tax=Actinoplanes sp. NPDC051513 TaxID=3363908 RepID=UPI0037B629BC
MSDFDAVLERLLNEPSFAAALAADPDATLSGYRLDADEAELLRSQASPDSGGGLAAVETRTNKSSTFGLFSAFADIGHTLSTGASTQHVAGAVGAPAAAQGLGDAPGAWGSGGGSAHEQWQPSEHSGFGSAPVRDGGADQDGLPPASSGFGDAPENGLGDGDAPDSGFGDAPRSGYGEPGRFRGTAEQIAPPKGYHPRIDANGDGHWDKATFTGTRGHGVEIRVDVNHDGHADFVGHDTDSDGLVDYADYDKDDNGTFEKRMYDDNGDGWLDRTVRHRNG